VFLAILAITVLAGTAGPAHATGLLFYALEDGQVRGFDMVTGTDSITIPASAFVGSPPNPATGRNIAYDPATDLMWYSADDNHVHSVVVSTLAAGPTISDIGDAFYGAIRTIAIDRFVRRLYISNSNGNVEVYELINNTRMYTIPLSAFGAGEPNPGNRRRLAADAWGYLWFAADDGTFKEFNPIQHNPHFTGREIPVSQQVNPGTPGQQRCFVAVRWSAAEHYLHYAAADGTVRTANLDTLMNVNVSFPLAWFLTSSNPGALRSLAIDPTWTPPGFPPAMPTGVTASDGLYLDMVLVTWNSDPSFPIFWVYRRESGTTDWPWRSVCYNNGWYEDIYAVPGVAYEYTVQACNTWGCSDYGTQIDAGFRGIIAPPTGVTATQGTLYDRVRLTWDSVPGANGYLVNRVPENGGAPTSEWVAGTTWDDMNALPAGSFWEYWVYACTDPSTCSSDSGSVWGWIGTFIFIDGFESGDLSRWSDTQY
jgi:hypothetical protein